jgi:methionyl-tRNA formyltransferase
MRLVFFGSGAFGLPTLSRLMGAHEIALVVTQPDRPAGRHRRLTATPVGDFAENAKLSLIKLEKVNDAAIVDQIRAINADAWVVIAFGQKLGRRLLDGVFAVNLHGSLLPKYRGAAPVNWAIIHGERETGVSVIALADCMDAGEIYGAAATPIDPHETAGELHDRLAALGPDVIEDVLRRNQEGSLISQPQDEQLATHAPKLVKADGLIRFDQPAANVRNRIHGMTPWPGCSARLDGRDLRLHRAEIVDTHSTRGLPGEVLSDYTIACAPGAVRLLDVQPPGRDVMTFQAYRNGHALRIGSQMESIA